MRDLVTLPKAHLHVHLESAIRPATLAEIGASHGIVVPAAVPTFRGFAAFAEHNALVRDCLRRPEDFARIAREFCEDEAAHGVGYAEVTFTAAAHGERLGAPDLPLEAVLAGLAEGSDTEGPGIEVRLILDHSRRRSVERAWETLRLARAHPEVVAIGVAGQESPSLLPFVPVFDAAREAGLHVVHHAGETAGPASVREAIGPGGTERIGHGIRVLDDPELVAEVRDRGLPLEVCPSSNVALGLVPSLAAHPLPRLRDAGLRVTLNADIPATVGTTITQEYARIRDTFGWDDETLAYLARSSVDASFAPPPTRDRLRGAIDGWVGS